MLQKPPPAVRPPRPGLDHGTDAYGGSVAPVIPPVVPAPIAMSTGAPSVSRPSAPARPVQTPTAPNTGPVLGGAGTGLAAAPANSGLPTAQPPAPPSPQPNVGGPPPLSTGTGRPMATGPLRGSLGRPVAGGTGNQAHPAPPSPGRSMPSGGLIGGTPGMGLGQPNTGNNQPRRVNPIGGVIGGGGAGTTPTGGAGSRPGGGRGIGAAHGMSPTGGAPFGSTSGRPGRRETEETRRWDPDHPWETDKGVPPVVRPPDEEGPIDPGPAIGFNR
jgi:hypothetical protein